MKNFLLSFIAVLTLLLPFSQSANAQGYWRYHRHYYGYYHHPYWHHRYWHHGYWYGGFWHPGFWGPGPVIVVAPY